MTTQSGFIGTVKMTTMAVVASSTLSACATMGMHSRYGSLESKTETSESAVQGVSPTSSESGVACQTVPPSALISRVSRTGFTYPAEAARIIALPSITVVVT